MLNIVGRYGIIWLSNKGRTLEAVSTSDRRWIFMGYDFIQFLAFLVDAGIIQSFRVTHDRIIVHIKNNRP